MKKRRCPFCKDTGEFKGEPCTTCARAAEIDYQTGIRPDKNENEKLMNLMMAGK